MSRNEVILTFGSAFFFAITASIYLSIIQSAESEPTLLVVPEDPGMTQCGLFRLEFQEDLLVGQKNGAKTQLRVEKTILLEELTPAPHTISKITVKDRNTNHEETVFASTSDLPNQMTFYSDTQQIEQIVLAYGLIEKLPPLRLDRELAIQGIQRRDLNGAYQINVTFDGLSHLDQNKTAYLSGTSDQTKIDLSDSSVQATYIRTEQDYSLLQTASGTEQIIITQLSHHQTQLNSQLFIHVGNVEPIACAYQSVDALLAETGLQKLDFQEFQKRTQAQLEVAIKEQQAPVSRDQFQRDLHELAMLSLIDYPSEQQSTRLNQAFDQSVYYLHFFPDDVELVWPLIESAVGKHEWDFVNLASDLLANTNHRSGFSALQNLVRELDSHSMSEQLNRNLMSFQFIQNPDEASIEFLREYYERESSWTKTKELSLLGLATLTGRSNTAGQSQYLLEELKAKVSPAQDGRVRAIALESIANLNHPDASEILKQLVLDSNTDIAARAIGAIGRLPGDEMTVYLLNFALNHKIHDQLNAKAWEALSNRQMIHDEWIYFVERYLVERSNNHTEFTLRNYLNALVNSPHYLQTRFAYEAIQQVGSLKAWEQEILANHPISF